MSRYSPLIVVLMALTLLIAGADRLVAQEASPAPSQADVPAIVAEYVAALNAHDADRVAALYTDDAVVEQVVRDGNVFRGPAEITGWIAANLQGIPDLTVTTQSVITEGDRIAWAWLYEGSYTGQYPDLPAGQGQPIELRGVSLLTLRDGMIAEEAVYFDNASFLSQVGALPRSGTPEAGTPTS